MVISLKNISDRKFCDMAAILRIAVRVTAIPAEPAEAARYCRNVVIASMDAIRASADRLEELTAKAYWPFPTYSDLLFY